MDITQFQKGQIITRIEPCIFQNYQTGGNHIDDRFIGKCITFLGLMNGMIYGTFQDDTGQVCMMSVPQHKWSLGWEFYKDPFQLLDGVKIGILNDLGMKLLEAEMREDYNECCRLKSEIDKIKISQNPDGKVSIFQNNNGIKMIS